mgnify:FL=1
MVRKELIFAAVFLLAGCTGTPIPPESNYNDVRVKVEWREPAWFTKGCVADGYAYDLCILYGFVITVGNQCVIYTTKPEHTTDWDRFETLGTLFLRCTDGNYDNS